MRRPRTPYRPGQKLLRKSDGAPLTVIRDGWTKDGRAWVECSWQVFGKDCTAKFALSDVQKRPVAKRKRTGVNKAEEP